MGGCVVMLAMKMERIDGFDRANLMDGFGGFGTFWTIEED